MGYNKRIIAGKTEYSCARLNYWTDIVTLVSGVVVFATGLVLLTMFHMGEGSLRAAALGLTRLAWVNLHRLSATAALLGITVHIVLHWHIIVIRVRRSLRGLTGKARPADLVLYFGFMAVILEGFAAWLILPGSPPLDGPVTFTHVVPVRHLCIDLHNISGLGLLPAAFIHVRRHMGWMIRSASAGTKTQEA